LEVSRKNVAESKLFVKIIICLFRRLNSVIHRSVCSHGLFEVFTPLSICMLQTASALLCSMHSGIAIRISVMHRKPVADSSKA